MTLWRTWYRSVVLLRGACSRRQSFLWMVLALVALSIRSDLLGVTSLARALDLGEAGYRRLLHLFHSPSVCVHRLTRLWAVVVARIFSPVIVGPYKICIADGIKVPKDGRKMPAVKRLHQESTNNSKRPFIMGHSFQALSLLVGAGKGWFAAVPLISRIHEGLVWSNRNQRTLLDRLATMFLETVPWLGGPFILVADAFYASRKIVTPLLRDGHHLVTRVRSNSVAFAPPPTRRKRTRGRPRIYGKIVRLRELFDDLSQFSLMVSPFLGEEDVRVRYRALDLVWRPVARVVRFVAIDHPRRGRILLMATDVRLTPREILAIYGHRFRIEVGFRQAVHTLASYHYHFWMKLMRRIRRNSGDQHLHMETDTYRAHIRRKIDAYHRFVQLGCIVQGLLLHLCLSHGKQVFRRRRHWFRTYTTTGAPSERIAQDALRATLDEFLELPCSHSKLRQILHLYRRRYTRSRGRSAG